MQSRGVLTSRRVPVTRVDVRTVAKADENAARGLSGVDRASEGESGWGEEDEVERVLVTALVGRGSIRGEEAAGWCGVSAPCSASTGRKLRRGGRESIKSLEAMLDNSQLWEDMLLAKKDSIAFALSSSVRRVIWTVSCIEGSTESLEARLLKSEQLETTPSSKEQTIESSICRPQNRDALMETTRSHRHLFAFS